MTMIYGHKWTSISECDDGTWLSGLADITPEQIGHGLSRLLTESSDWPPSLPEFRNLCLDKKEYDPHKTAAYKEHKMRALPHLKSSKESAKKFREELLANLGLTGE